MNTIQMLALGVLGAAIIVPQLTGGTSSESGKPTKTINVIRQADRDVQGGSSWLTDVVTRPKRVNPPSTYGCEFGCGGGSFSSPRKTKKTAGTRRSGPRSVVIDQNESGHYKTTARMNGRRVPVLVDTGATAVAINERSARRLGINVTDSDFKHEVQTANGTALYAKATIKSIRVGGIVMDNVEAAVLRDKSLSITLLGMSFLSRLAKFEISDKQMSLLQ